MERKLATQFQRMSITVNEPRPGFDMHIAVWRNSGRGECVIGAPTLKALEQRWVEITRTPLDAARAQHVIVLHGDGPEPLLSTNTKEPKSEVDACEICGGSRGGVPGNENIVESCGEKITMCDYCSADEMHTPGFWKEVPTG